MNHTETTTLLNEEEAGAGFLEGRDAPAEEPTSDLEEPRKEETTTEEPKKEEPMTEEPMTEETTMKEAMTEEPTIEETTTEKPMTEETTTEVEIPYGYGETSAEEEKYDSYYED